MENKGMPYNSDDKTVAQVNGIEPLAGKETYVTTNVKHGPTYNVFWPEGKDFGSSSGPPLTEVTIDDPVRRAMAENTANENQRYGISSSNKKRSSSKRNSTQSASQKRSESASEKRRESKKALPDYDDVDLPGRVDSQRKLTSSNGSQDSSACCFCRMSARCIVVIVVVVMLLAAAGIIAGVIAATHKPPQVCTEFVKYKDTFVLGSELRTDLETSERCAKACLYSPVCGGYDWDRLKKQCFLVTGAVGAELLQNATTTDHFERQVVCNKTEANPLVCHMLHSSVGNAAGGHKAGRVTLEKCNRLCLLEDGCKGIDYNFDTGGECWVHTLTDNTMSNDCCHHYSKVCQRCIYTEERNKYAQAAILADKSIKEPSQCGDLCNLKPNCKGFDFEYASKKCALVYIENFSTTYLESSINYKKGACFDIKAPT